MDQSRYASMIDVHKYFMLVSIPSGAGKNALFCIFASRLGCISVDEQLYSRQRLASRLGRPFETANTGGTDSRIGLKPEDKEW